MPAATIQITANREQIAAQGTAYLPVTAWLGDEEGVGIPGETIGMACPPGTGTFPGGATGANAITDAGGYATFPAFTASSALGLFEPLITYLTLFPAHAQFTTIDSTVPASMSPYSGNNQAIPLDTPFLQPLVVRVANGVNGPVAGVAVEFIAPESGPSLTWAAPATNPVTRISDVSGLATSPTPSANASAGTYLVSANSPGLFSTYFQLTNGGPPPILDTSALSLCEV